MPHRLFLRSRTYHTKKDWKLWLFQHFPTEDSEVILSKYKIMHGVNDVQKEAFFEMSNEEIGTCTRGNSMKIQKRYAKFSFTFRIVSSWSMLPNQVVCAVSVNAFKNEVDARGLMKPFPNGATSSHMNWGLNGTRQFNKSFSLISNAVLLLFGCFKVGYMYKGFL